MTPVLIIYCILYSAIKVLVPYMGGITFLDYVKELPKAKREAKGSTKGGYATNATTKKSAPKKATLPPKAPPASAGGAAPESTSRGLPEVGGGSEIDSIEKQILAKVSTDIVYY